MRSVLPHGLSLALILFASVATAAPIVLNSSFEAGPNSYGAVPDWTQAPFPSGNPNFAGGYLTGTSTTGFFPWDNGTVPGEGTSGMVGFIQAYAPFGSGTMSLEQNVSGFVAGQTYTLTYDENSRAGTSTPLMEVFVGGQSVVAQHLDTAVEGGGSYTTPFHVVTSVPFTIPGGGSALVEFRVTTTGGDSTATIDNVVINGVPEPSSLLLAGLGVVGLLAVARPRRSA